MSKQSKGTTSAKNSSKNPPDISGENYVFVKYSDFMDFIQSVNDASIALSRLAIASADIKLMSLRPTAWTTTGAGLSQKSTDISVIKHNMQSDNKPSAAEESEKLLARTLRSTVSPLPDSADGRMRKSRKK